MKSNARRLVRIAVSIALFGAAASAEAQTNIQVNLPSGAIPIFNTGDGSGYSSPVFLTGAQGEMAYAFTNRTFGSTANTFSFTDYATGISGGNPVSLGTFTATQNFSVYTDPSGAQFLINGTQTNTYSGPFGAPSGDVVSVRKVLADNSGNVVAQLKFFPATGTWFDAPTSPTLLGLDPAGAPTVTGILTASGGVSYLSSSTPIAVGPSSTGGLVITKSVTYTTPVVTTTTYDPGSPGSPGSPAFSFCFSPTVCFNFPATPPTPPTPPGYVTTTSGGVSATGNGAYYLAPGAGESLDAALAGTFPGAAVAIVNPTGGGTPITATAINASGEVAGNAVNSTGVTYAFRTGASGSATGGVTFGLGGGVGSYALAENDAGQVGGYIVTSTGLDEAFISTARGGLLVGLDAATGDSMETVFLNNNGAALLEDMATGLYYLYNAGVVIPVDSLGFSANAFNPATRIDGFNNQYIYVGDPTGYALPSLTASSLDGYVGAVDITSTSTYAAVAAGQGGATPPSSFFSDPTAGSGGSSVPAPTSLWLSAVGLFGAFFARRRRGVVGV